MSREILYFQAAMYFVYYINDTNNKFFKQFSKDFPNILENSLNTVRRLYNISNYFRKIAEDFQGRSKDVSI